MSRNRFGIGTIGQTPQATLPMFALEVRGLLANEWLTEKVIYHPEHLQFRYKTLYPGVVSAEWQMSDTPFKARDPSGESTKLMGSGVAGPATVAGSTRMFWLKLADRIPSSPSSTPRHYYIRVIGRDDNGQYHGSPSRTVTLIYRRDDGSQQFPSPTLDGIFGSENVRGSVLTKNGKPLAVVGSVFHIVGSDIEDAKIEFLKDGQLILEKNASPQSIKPVGSGKVIVTMDTPPFENGLYSIRLRTGWGVTAAKPLYIAGGQKAEVQSWSVVGGGTYENHTWTEECQGITTDGHFWYITSNNDDDQAIYKFTIGMKLVAKADLSGCDHVGDPGYCDGKLYLPLTGPKKLLVLPTDLDLRKREEYLLHGKTVNDPDPRGVGFAWCAINPINGYLYTSDFDSTRNGVGLPRPANVYYYKLASPTSRDFVLAGSFALKHWCDNIQGGAVTPTGHLILASDGHDDTHGIYCYNAFTGKYYGRKTFPLDQSWNVAEEVEGITVSPPNTASVNGTNVNIHLVILDNDKPDNDDVFFKHVAVPNLSELFGF